MFVGFFGGGRAFAALLRAMYFLPLRVPDRKIHQCAAHEPQRF